LKESLLTRGAWTAAALVLAPRQARFPYAPPAAIERAQRTRIRRTVAHAYKHVPYYRETMDRCGLRPGDLVTASDLDKLPLIEREQVQRDPEYFVSTAEPIDRYLRSRTGGSSGRPVTVYRDSFARIQGATHRRRWLSFVSKLVGKRRPRVVVISTGGGRGQATNRAFLARRLIQAWSGVPERRFSIFDPPAQHVAAINEFRPDLIGAFGSYIEALFVHLHRTGQRLDGPKLVLYWGDALSQSARRLIQEEFGLPAFSVYSAKEAFHIGFECDQHRGYHLNVDLNPLRLIDDSGGTVPDGENGEVVVSNLVNRATILLNYRLGDVAAKVPGQCPCGRSLPLLSYLEGRTDDWLRSPSGALRHPQAVRTLFTQEPGVLRYQVVQRSPSDFAASLVVDDGCDQAVLRRRLERKLVERLGDGTTTEISFVDSLPRTARGKVLTVVPMR
jgi:phenylacetate-CoA ligase